MEVAFQSDSSRGVRDVSMHLRIYFPERPAEGAAVRRRIVVRVSGGATAPAAPVHSRTSWRAFRRDSRFLTRQASAIPSRRFSSIIAASRLVKKPSWDRVGAKWKFVARRSIFGVRSHLWITRGSCSGRQEQEADQDRLFWTAKESPCLVRSSFASRSHRSYY